MWIKESFYKYAIGIVLVLTIILLMYYTAPVFYPILWFVAAILLPILFATLLYYILRPLVTLLERWIPRYLSILIVYAVLALFSVTIGLLTIPNIIDTINDVSPEKIASLKLTSTQLLDKMKSYIPFSNLPMVENILLSYAPKVNSLLYSALVNIIKTGTDIAIALALTPIVLYYFLRDDDLLSGAILRFVPKSYATEVKKTLNEVDSTLSEFILAQMTIAVVIGVFLFFGYFLIGLPTPFSLALFAMIFYVIPFFGTFIAIIPALIVGATIGFSMVLKVIVVMFVAHFCESNLLTPRLMSQRLKIHPLTVILLLLAAGSLYGIIGMLLVTPTYAILKVLALNFYKISRFHYTMAKSKVDK